MTQFEFDFRVEDFVEKLLRDRPELGPYRDVLLEYAALQAGNDEDLEAFLGADSFAPAIGVSRSAPGQLIPSGLGGTMISFDTPDFQSSELFEWDGATKVSVGQRGIVQVTANALFAPSGAGTTRFGDVVLNGISILVPLTRVGPFAASPMPIVGARLKPVEAGDFLELRVNQDTGAGLNTSGSLEVAFLGGIDG